MNLPGFTAEASLETSSGRYRSPGRGSGGAPDAVVAQARIGGFGGIGGDLFFHWPSRCELKCTFAAVACNIACAGTAAGYPACLAACAAAEIACLAACD